MWEIKFKKSVQKDLRRLSKNTLLDIKKLLMERVAADPKALGKPARGRGYPFWIYRMGDHRIICYLYDNDQSVLVLRVGHRSKIYKDFPPIPED